MAPHPHILFPLPTNVTGCLTSCSEACLYYGFCDLTSPPPPPPPDSPIHLPRFLHLPIFLLIPSSLLIFLSLSLFFLCVFLYFRRRRRRRNRNLNSTPVTIVPSVPMITNDADQHYVWYIRTVGLDDSAIHAISAWSYKSGDGTGTGNGTGGCAVCLGEFHDGELLRLLPKCDHAFHVSCIDTWLRAHANCPLCRALVTAPGNSSMPPPPPSPSDESDEFSDAEGLNTSEGNGGVSGSVNEPSSSSRTQPVRRCASMGSLPVDCKDRKFEKGSGSKSKDVNGTLDLETVELERSRSCSCNGFFLSR